jgi:Holliday junction resolvase RusA-like endonuclease
MPNGAMLPAGTAESRKRMYQWREDIRHEAKLAMDGRPPMVGPIRLMVEFRMPVPSSTIRKYQHGWLCHTKKPDVDKLFRMLSDAMTAIVWKDDSQVCFSTINKVYAWNGATGAMVIVEEVDDDAAKRFAATSGMVRAAIDQLA